MKRIVFSLFLMMGVTLVFMPMNKAGAVDFDITANIPTATGVSITATEVDSASNVFGSTVTEFNFNPMVFNTALGIFLPDHFYAVDVGVIGGAGATDVHFEYSEGPTDRPTGQPASGSFGFRSTATFVRILGGPLPADQTQEFLPISGGTNESTQLLKNFIGAGVDIDGADLNGGFFRVFVGVYPGGNINGVDIAADGGAPFTNSDVPGLYKGLVTITATVT